jgi:hypothetical protein
MTSSPPTQRRNGRACSSLTARGGGLPIGVTPSISLLSHTQDWLVLESASVSYGKATPYFPIIDLLKRYTHVEERDDVRTIRAKVTRQVLTLDETLQETIPALLSLLDALPEDSSFRTLEPPQRRQRTLEALKRVLLRESQVQPVLLVRDAPLPGERVHLQARPDARGGLQQHPPGAATGATCPHCRGPRGAR